jgi:hypothetical protein
MPLLLGSANYNFFPAVQRETCIHPFSNQTCKRILAAEFQGEAGERGYRRIFLKLNIIA